MHRGMLIATVSKAFSVMKLKTLKFAVAFSSLFVWVSLIVTDVCLFSQRECFPHRPKYKEPIIALLKGLSFQETLDAHENEENLVDLPSGLNQHVWANNCVKTIEMLCNFPVFPKAPDRRHIIFRTEISAPRDAAGVDGHRLFGYVLPNLTGEYQFALASNGFAELWLSLSSSWRVAKKIAFIRPFDVQSTITRGEFGASKTQTSTKFHLEGARRYYIEILYTLGAQSKQVNFLQVAWKRPQETYFEIIEGEYLSLFKNDSEKEMYKMFDDELPHALSCMSKNQKGYGNKYMRPEVLPYLEHKAVSKALDFCEYRPSYLLYPANLIGFQRYDGVSRHAHRTYSFPYPIVDSIVRRKGAAVQFYAEYPLDEEETWSVVNRYMDAIEESYSGKYKLESIKRVEKKEDPQKGGRYLLELVVEDRTNAKNYILAEYVFQPNGKNVPLCYPNGLQWNRTADVYLILTAKNLGRWVHHFIKNVEKIVQETRDEHLHVVIYDFDSPDIDLKQAFQRSVLTNYHFITKPGKYSRTVSFSEAIKSIKDPNAIVVTIDLHLDIGSLMINDIRKHCSKGKTVYAPQIVFLHCGGSSALPKGQWYHYSYGTIAMYREDWVKFGGFSEDFTNKNTWGGEDWDIIDGAVKGGLEIERKRSPWVYHYHHTKAGMW